MERKEPDRQSTEELFQKMSESPSLNAFLDEHGPDIANYDTPSYLAHLLEQNHLTRQQVIFSANLERSFGHQIFNGLRHPKRNTLLRIGFAMRLTFQETQRLLTIAQRGALYLKNRRDAAIAFCILNRYELLKAEELLESIEEEPLSEGL